MSEAGYYAWLKRPPSAHALADAALLKRVQTIHANSRETYGSPRVHAELQAVGAAHGRKRVARLMHAAGLVGASRGDHHEAGQGGPPGAGPGGPELHGDSAKPAVGGRYYTDTVGEFRRLAPVL